MATEPNSIIDLSDIIDTVHENKWVAIAPDCSRVIGFADRLGDLMRTVEDKNAVFHKSLPHDVSFAPIVY